MQARLFQASDMNPFPLFSIISYGNSDTVQTSEIVQHSSPRYRHTHL
jgi:hypothetical protein